MPEGTPSVLPVATHGFPAATSSPLSSLAV